MAKKPTWVDSTYTEQAALYKNALDKYRKENSRQTKIVNDDAKLAQQGVLKNRTAGLTSLNEDFASRGLGRSGLRVNNLLQAGQQYTQQSKNVETGRVRGVGDLGAQKTKYESDYAQQVGAAKHEAYARLAARQKLV